MIRASTPIRTACAIILLLSALVAGEATGRTWVVDPSGVADSRAIAPAVAKAAPGDTVHVLPGLYHELITLKSGVALVGSDSSAVLVEYDRDEAVLVGKGVCDVAIQGMTFQHELGSAPCGSPVFVLEDCVGVEIRGNVILGSGYLGIKAMGCRQLGILGNIIAENAWQGVVVVGCDSVLVTDNIIRHNKTGVAVLASNAVVRGNRIENNTKYGILVGCGGSGAAVVAVEGNLISGSPIGIVDVTPPDAKQISLGDNECSGAEYSLLVLPVNAQHLPVLSKGNERIYGYYLNYRSIVDQAIWIGDCSE